MIFPTKIHWNKLKKAEFLWLAEHRCEAHGMRYIEHPRCFLEEKPENAPLIERVGMLDIETTNLHADYGYIFSYCIKELDGEIEGYCVSPEEIRNHDFDKKLMKLLCKALPRYHRIIVYWGKGYRFDIPFVRSRALKWGISFPKHKDIIVNDLYDTVKKQLRLHRNRLETACDFLGIPSKEHRMNPSVWQKALSGDQESLDWIFEHNKEDVISTEAVWKVLHEFSPNSNTSI